MSPYPACRGKRRNAEAVEADADDIAELEAVEKWVKK